jgi:hypothetical protein
MFSIIKRRLHTKRFNGGGFNQIVAVLRMTNDASTPSASWQAGLNSPIGAIVAGSLPVQAIPTTSWLFRMG